MTTVEIHDDKFTIDGEVTYRGRDWRGYPIEGLLMNSRMIQATLERLQDEKAVRSRRVSLSWRRR